MAPSDKTALRRIQRAGQRQRMQEALANLSATPPMASAPSAQAMPAEAIQPEKSAHDVTISALGRTLTAEALAEAMCQQPEKVAGDALADGMVTNVAPQSTLTAEAFAEAICQLVDSYRAGLNHARVGLEPNQCAAHGDCNVVHEQGESDSGQIGIDAQPMKVCRASRPVSPNVCSYTVRNTFIDVLPTPNEAGATCKAIFSTWPEDKQTSSEDELFCGASTESHCTGTLVAPHEAGEIIEDHEEHRDFEEGELSDEEDFYCDSSGASAFAGSWQASDEPVTTSDETREVGRPVIETRPVTRRDELRNCGANSLAGVGHFQNEHQPSQLEFQTERLKDLLRQSLSDFQVGPCHGFEHPHANHQGTRWRKTTGDTKHASFHSDDSKLWHGWTCEDQQRGGSGSPKFAIPRDPAGFCSQWLAFDPAIVQVS